MTLGEMAALISAFGFVALVIYLCLVLKEVKAVAKEFKTTVVKVNESITVLTKDVDHLFVEIEALMNKANALVDDVNGKLEKTDPLFTAIGDVGESVSDVKASTSKMTHTISSKGVAFASGAALKFLAPFSKKKVQKLTKDSKQEVYAVKPEIGMGTFIDKTPSQTGEEIIIKKKG